MRMLRSRRQASSAVDDPRAFSVNLSPVNGDDDIVVPAVALVAATA